MRKKEPVKIALITGYLGAGKTTLLNHILSNDEGIRAAVIVNDIGEVNVDAELIAKGGVVTQENSNLVPLTNGCICCTLRDDLATQLRDLAKTGKFDYIIIEASGICEPIPIAQTIADICEESTEDGLPMMLDNIIAVVDCARMHDEFEDGRSLLKDSYEEEDIENLLIQQLEFCNTVLLNKVDTVDEYQLGELKAIVKSLQTKAVIIEANYAKVKIADVLNTGRFDLESSMESAGWIEAIQNADIEDHDHDDDDDDDDDEHEHHHHHDDDDDDDDDEHEHHHHHHDDDDDDEHEHHHHDHDHEHEHAEAVVDENGNRIYKSHSHHHHHHHHHGGHDADEIFVSWGMETPAKYTEEEIRQILARLDDEDTYGFILRSKGMVPDPEGRWIHFDYVPEETEVRYGAA
ncbi:MAG: GTP-binding protein, partial [Lachnospiraceae bacterium]|nr:GTP-binding protein [Lachnospiraceae bacterium]